jgi:GxxExxY protein
MDREEDRDTTFSALRARRTPRAPGTISYAPVPLDVEAVARTCIDAGIDVHRQLGPGFKEAIYSRALCLELHARGVSFECEKRILVRYKSWTIPGQTIDLIVAGKVLVELKAVPKLRKIHVNQVISYLKTTDLRLALIVNFNTRVLKDGLRRVVL